MLKSGDAEAILRSLGDAEQRLADARVNPLADKCRESGGVSPQWASEFQTTVEKEHEDQKLDDYQEPKSLQTEGLIIRDRTQSNRT